MTKKHLSNKYKQSVYKFKKKPFVITPIMFVVASGLGLALCVAGLLSPLTAHAETLPPPQAILSGTAWPINGDGYFITAGHVQSELNTHNFLIDYHHILYPATFVAIDLKDDVALMKINEKTPDYLPFQLHTPVVGDPVSVLGYPDPYVFGWDLKTTHGLIISDIMHQLGANLPVTNIATDAKACSGNSGGPILGKSGVIGILDYSIEPAPVPGQAESECGLDNGGPNTNDILHFLMDYDVKTWSLVMFHLDTFNTNTPTSGISLIFGW